MGRLEKQETRIGSSNGNRNRNENGNRKGKGLSDRKIVNENELVPEQITVTILCICRSKVNYSYLSALRISAIKN